MDLVIEDIPDDYVPDEIEDRFGEIRRCGSMPSFPPTGSDLVSFASAFKVWTKEECRQAIAGRSFRADEIFPGEGEENQGSHGSCNGYALANAAWRAAYASGNTRLTKRSGTYPYSWMNGGQDRGSRLYDGYKVGQAKGLPSLERCPWNMIYRNQTQQFDAEAAEFLVDSPYLIHTWDEYLTATAGPFVLVVAVHVGAQFERMRGDICGLDEGMGNHAVCQDDARVNDSGEIQAKVIMDWGLKHGVRGCGWVTERHLRPLMEAHQFYAIPYGQHGTGTIR